MLLSACGVPLVDFLWLGRAGPTGFASVHQVHKGEADILPHNSDVLIDLRRLW
jgi:hypothetical protein